MLLFWGGHVALLFYDTRAASVLVGVGEGMEKGRKKKNLCRAEHVLLRWRLPQCSTCNPFHWEVDCWVFKTEKTFRTSLSQRGAKVFPVFIICLSNRKTYSELWSSDLEVASIGGRPTSRTRLLRYLALRYTTAMQPLIFSYSI